MHGYAQRNIRAWHRRFSRLGWTIFVLDRIPNSPLNISNFLDISDPSLFPAAFTDGRIGGDYAPQHTSDLVRWPLLLRYGGVYADVGLMQIGDLDALWNTTIADPSSPYDILSYNMGPDTPYALTNYFLCSSKGNPLFQRCHKLLLALWEGRDSTEGMHTSALLKGVPLMGANSTFTIVEEGKPTIETEEVRRLLSDYIVQGQVMTMVMALIDVEDGWNGPEYTAKHIYAPDYMVGSQLINELTEWDGNKAFRLMSLEMPKEGGEEEEEQKEARRIVEGCLKKSFGFKLAHGLVVRVCGETLGSLWRANAGSDAVEGTYAAWLRYGMIHWCQDELPERTELEVLEAVKRGPLLSAV